VQVLARLATNGDAKCEKRSWEWIIVTDGETAADKCPVIA